MDDKTLKKATDHPESFNKAVEEVIDEWFKSNPQSNKFEMSFSEIEDKLNKKGWSMGGIDPSLLQSCILKNH